MIRFRVDISDNTNLGGIVAGIRAQLTNLKPAMDEIGKYMVRSVQDRIAKEGPDPDGHPWDPLRDLTHDLKGHDRILHETGALRRSIKADADGKGVTIGSDLPYAQFMQKGVKRTGGMFPNRVVPPRPFLGFSKENARRIREILSKHLVRGRNG